MVSSVRKSQDNRSSATSAKPAMAFAVALQILKVIVTRAEEDLSAMYPGVWSRVGSVLRAALSDGDAAFALRHREYSEPPSPVHSPRASAFALNGQSDDPFLSPADFRTQKRPRMIDYLTWSFVQWLCLRRSPLAIQMRAFVQEKVASLDQELSLQGTSVSFSTPRPRSRPISTIFSKPRRSMIGDATSSAASTPRSSTLLNSSISLPAFDDFGVRSSTPRKADDGGRQAGYALMPSPLTPSRRAARESGPKIVHLGPVSPSALGEASGRRSISPSGRGRSVLSALAVAAEMTVTSPILVRMTYRRIRIAQAVLGYAVLLPFWEGSGNSEDEEMVDGAVRAWTKADAVEAVMQETKDLMEEWREDYADVGDESAVLVDVEDSSDGTP
ncbi:hypothetical protein A0H81_12593 [Grifola frondosa]|uniref:Uncharacterized protein n=1 Tax=Grifola frondosa TaxID=5627 RepID=A0A1C7LRJ2_GRIFR|nr:hypothetical protein A0H81_12593 [Grifola frondosa]